VHYLRFLERLHERLAPTTYLEIGVRHGDSLRLARAPAVGIDPEPRLRVELPESVTLFRETSDAYFARERPLEPLRGRPIGMSFIDGLHLAEFALRDFVAVERLAHWTSAIVFDDVLPRERSWTNRRRTTRLWTGDVYKMLRVLDRHRPDLIRLRIDTEPSGLLLVLGLDPANRVLAKRYDRIEPRLVKPDPQLLPRAVRLREGARDPEAVLAARFWDDLRRWRERGTGEGRGRPALRRAVATDLGLPGGGGLLNRLRRRLPA
jgi:hypothetical protein